MQWKSTSSSRTKNARMSRSKFEAMLIVFYDIQGTVTAQWVPSGQTVHQQYYIEVLTKLHEGEKETTGIMEKRVEFAPGQRASPQRIVCEGIFS